MGEMKHADGPWSVVPYGDGDSLVIHSDDENRVCFMATHGGSRASWERIQANAALIAAAPTLYEALTRLLPYFEGEHAHDHPDSVFARAALASVSPQAVSENGNVQGGSAT